MVTTRVPRGGLRHGAGCPGAGPTDLAAQATVDTWRQWSFPWKATPGGHTLTVRATDGTGVTQTEERTRTVPDGASGRHSVFVTAG